MFEQPKTDEVVSSARKGTCATCGAKGVLVTHPPLPRCVDMAACDRKRALNAVAFRVTQLAVEQLRSRGVRYATKKDVETYLANIRSDRVKGLAR